jgi:hypothetical protein
MNYQNKFLLCIFAISSLKFVEFQREVVAVICITFDRTSLNSTMTYSYSYSRTCGLFRNQDFSKYIRYQFERFCLNSSIYIQIMTCRAMNYSTLPSANMQVLKWRLCWHPSELVATDAEGTLCYFLCMTACRRICQKHATT